MTSPLDDLGSGKYLLLTTLRRDGTPVGTPVWVVRDADALLVVTQADSGKVRRIRANPAVTVASCDARGRSSGPAVDAVAELLDDAGTARARSLIVGRYGLLGRLFMWRGRRTPQVGLRIPLAPDDARP